MLNIHKRLDTAFGQGGESVHQMNPELYGEEAVDTSVAPDRGIEVEVVEAPEAVVDGVTTPDSPPTPEEVVATQAAADSASAEAQAQAEGAQAPSDGSDGADNQSADGPDPAVGTPSDALLTEVDKDHTVDALKKALDERGVKYPSDAKKADLVALEATAQTLEGFSNDDLLAVAGDGHSGDNKAELIAAILNT